ncbi:HIRAN domain-containing protein [Actinoplanes sp. G11-F43]|uniref:HIRAN domain-containing protein n=1 Tax=Actinoplanes sp. G11-F43 TaxID=3424130 RepID=UPI003D33BC59
MSIPFDLWGQRGWAGMDVAGESHYVKEIRSLFGADLKKDDAELTITVRLVPDPKNRFDRNAVGVWAGSRQVGHLPRDEAARYAPVLTSMIAQGWEPQVSARVWASQWTGYDGSTELSASVRLDLAEPHMLVPANTPPKTPHRMLPVGGAIQVTGEEHHLDALSPWLRPEGQCWVHVTLHEVTEQLARSSRTVVEVRIDDARVGQLTPKMSGEVLPAIRHLADDGLTTGTRAIVKGNRIKAEVVLYVARAHELPDSWLTGSSTSTPPATPAERMAPQPVVIPAAASAPAVRQTHGPIPPPPQGIRFTVPPGWPQPPAGWYPPPGWRPDPTWPLEPDDWQWWVPFWDR